MFLVQIVSASYPSLLPYHGGADRYVDATSSIPWQYWSGDRMRERERERERESGGGGEGKPEIRLKNNYHSPLSLSGPCCCYEEEEVGSLSLFLLTHTHFMCGEGRRGGGRSNNAHIFP